MSYISDASQLYSKYMALAHSSAERDRINATEIAKELLKSPIRNARDLNAKLKILEAEISNLKNVDPKLRLKLLELIANLAQAELRAGQLYPIQLLQTKH